MKNFSNFNQAQKSPVQKYEARRSKMASLAFAHSGHGVTITDSKHRCAENGIHRDEEKKTIHYLSPSLFSTSASIRRINSNLRLRGNALKSSIISFCCLFMLLISNKKALSSCGGKTPKDGNTRFSFTTQGFDTQIFNANGILLRHLCGSQIFPSDRSINEVSMRFFKRSCA